MDDRAGTGLEITKGGLLASLAVLLVAALCVRLGFWQLDRLDQRVERNRAVAERMEAPPATIEGAVRDTAGLLFRRVELHGRYHHDLAFVLAGRGHAGAPGVHLFTPLRLSGDGPAVLVNRGWLPAPDAANADLSPFRTSGPDTVRGLAMALPERDDVPDPDRFRATWFRLDASALRAQYPYPVEPYYVQRLPEGDGPRPLPIAVDPPALGRGPHLGYAVQWFSFASIAVIGWLIMVVRSRRERR